VKKEGVRQKYLYRGRKVAVAVGVPRLGSIKEREMEEANGIVLQYCLTEKKAVRKRKITTTKTRRLELGFGFQNTRREGRIAKSREAERRRGIRWRVGQFRIMNWGETNI